MKNLSLKLSVLCLAALACMASPAAAQDDNRTLNVSVGELEYTVKEQPTSKTGKVVSGAKNIKTALDGQKRILIISTD